MHFGDSTFCKDLVNKRLLSRQTVEGFKMKRQRIMNLPRNERQGWGLWPPLLAAEVTRSWKPDRTYAFPRLPRPKRQQRTEPGPSHLVRHPLSPSGRCSLGSSAASGTPSSGDRDMGL